MKVIILGKRDFNKFCDYNRIDDDNVESQNIMFISIHTHWKGKENSVLDDVKSWFRRQHPNVMIMHFGDYPEEYVNKHTHEGPTGLFNEYKAKKLYEFIKSNKDKQIAVVHCGAGVSRSGAVGSFIYDIYGTMTWEEFKRKNPKINPNVHVLKLLRKEHEKDEKVS
jgi:predicted protein tyrosine phosphatase